MPCCVMASHHGQCIRGGMGIKRSREASSGFCGLIDYDFRLRRPIMPGTLVQKSANESEGMNSRAISDQ